MNYCLIEPLFPQENITAVERVLTNRGIPYNEITHYLYPNKNDLLEPDTIEGIHEGAKMLISHIAQNDKVLIQIDSDCDGMTSAALLINYLNCLFPGFVQNNIVYRVHTGKQHGLILDTIPEDIKLVIAPDSSSNQYDIHKELYNLGIDVLVIDHHKAEKVSEYACVINNQLCSYENKTLSGVGMVYKLCCYLDKILEQDNASQFQDLVALGCVADMMDLRNLETRYLVDKGLKQIRNPYFKGMVAKQEYSLEKNGGLTPHTVGFYIAPYVNATMRAGTQEEKLMLFESMLDYRGYEQVPSTKRGCKGQVETRVEQACRNCTNVKNRQTKAVDASLEIIELLIKVNDLLKNQILVIQLDEKNIIDKNITGLIANKIANLYCKPTLILSKNIDENGNIIWEGSGRSYQLDNLRQLLINSNLTKYVEGHNSAFGIGIIDNKLDDFIQYTNDLLKDLDFTPQLYVDLIWNAQDFNSKDILDIASLESVWGKGVEKPLVAIENVKVHSGDCQLLKGSTLKITLPNGTSLIKFGSSEEEYEQLYSELGCVTINVVGECKRNVWNGIISPQIEIKDYEIVGTNEYYF